MKIESSTSDLISTALAPQEVVLWEQYLRLEDQGQRKPALQILTAFIDALRADTQQRRIDFTKAFCLCVTDENVTLRTHSGGRDPGDQAVSRIADKSIAIPLRQPLLSEVIGPCLVALYYQKDVRAPYWIAFLYGHLRSLPANLMPEGFPELTENGLLREALKCEPGNAKSRTQLIHNLSRQFNYALHELPSGVLFGWNGATVTECTEWLKALKSSET